MSFRQDNWHFGFALFALLLFIFYFSFVHFHDSIVSKKKLQSLKRSTSIFSWWLHMKGTGPALQDCVSFTGLLKPSESLVIFHQTYYLNSLDSNASLSPPTEAKSTPNFDRERGRPCGVPILFRIVFTNSYSSSQITVLVRLQCHFSFLNFTYSLLNHTSQGGLHTSFHKNS